MFNVDGEVIGPLRVCGPSARFDDAAIARYAPMVMTAAEVVSWALG